PALAKDLRSLWATVWIAEELARSDQASAAPAAGSRARSDTALWPAATNPGAHRRGEPAGHSGLQSAGDISESAEARRFGEYELFEELGRGGMGVVWRARDVARGRIVALKRLLSGPESSPHDLERFRLESQAAARLAHPYIVPVFQVGEVGGQP